MPKSNNDYKVWIKQIISITFIVSIHTAILLFPSVYKIFKFYFTNFYKDCMDLTSWNKYVIVKYSITCCISLGTPDVILFLLYMLKSTILTVLSSKTSNTKNAKSKPITLIVTCHEPFKGFNWGILSLFLLTFVSKYDLKYFCELHVHLVLSR